MVHSVKLTPLTIAVLALAHDRHENNRLVCVWGSWRKVAIDLCGQHMLRAVGSMRGTREMEETNLSGKHRRGKEGRLMYTFSLRADRRDARELAARCAWAMKHKTGRMPSWRDVPDAVPSLDGRRCSACLCTPSRPCTIHLEGGGTAVCVPAGVFNFDRCSACLRAA